MKPTLTMAGIACLIALGTSISAPAGSSPEHNCDFAAVLMKTGYVVPDAPPSNDPPGSTGPYDDPDDFFYDYIIQRSSASTNPNGYGICYARDQQTTIDRRTQVWNSANRVYSANPGPLDNARAAILNASNRACMVMAHSRMGTTGGEQQHPYYLDWHGRTYALMHNGSMQKTTKYPLFWDLWNNCAFYGQWWDEHPSNWNADPSNYSGFNGTELVFHWVMKHVMLADGDFVAGFHQAITLTVSNRNGAVNLHEAFKDPTQNSFNVAIFDGDSLWIYRNTPSHGANLNISYKDFGKFIGIKTGVTLEGGVQVKPYSLLHILRSGRVIEYPEFPDYGRHTGGHAGCPRSVRRLPCRASRETCPLPPSAAVRGQSFVVQPAASSAGPRAWPSAFFLLKQ
ncbi:MAG: hypothetical protein ABSH34_00475 [Verrucomicrobiota bacterium]|jgi:hypothetical protein